MSGHIKLLIVIFCVAKTSAFSQCEDANKLEFGGSLGSNTRNYIPFDLNISDTIQYCCDIKKIQRYSDPVIHEAEEFILTRANEEFYKRLKITQVNVNYPSTVDINYSNQVLYDLSAFDVTYWITYLYTNNNIQYGFGLEFNKNGEMISANQFPSFSKNKNAELYTDVCDAISVVKNDERFRGKEVEYIELAYLDEPNSFCWLVAEKIEGKCGANDFIQAVYYVNANTNKIEEVKTKHGTLFVCCFGTKKKFFNHSNRSHIVRKKRDNKNSEL